MEKAISLIDFIKDEFVPEPKQIPERIKKEVTLDLENNFFPFCGLPLEYHYLSNARPLITIKYDISLRVEYIKDAQMKSVLRAPPREIFTTLPWTCMCCLKKHMPWTSPFNRTPHSTRILHGRRGGEVLVKRARHYHQPAERE